MIYCLNATSKEIEDRFENNRKIVENELSDRRRQRGMARVFHMTSFLIAENGEIYLKILSLFTAKKCDSFQLVTINKFSKESLKWKTDRFFPADVDKFHGCELIFSTMGHDDFPTVFSNGTHEFDGYAVQLFNALASSLNYTVKYVPPSTNLTIDLLVAACANNFLFDDTFCLPIFSSFYSIIVPPGELYTPLEKLFLPFDLPTWVLFFFFFFIGYFSVFLLNKFADRAAQSFIYGEGVRTPGMNIFLVFMGGGMTTLPRKSFPRFLLMSFILYCLVMRYLNIVFQQPFSLKNLTHINELKLIFLMRTPVNN